MNLEKVIAVRTSKTIYRDGLHVVKVFDNDYSKSDVLNEALNQAKVEATEILIPKIESVTMIDKKWAIVSEFIHGSTLGRLLEQNPEKMEEYLSLFVDLHINLHKVKAPLLTELNDKIKRKIELTELLATKRYALRLQIETMPKKNVICHGDFNPSNIIIDDNKNAYILDWSHATIGHPLADVANTYLIFLEDSIKLANRYMEMYCRKTGTKAKEILDWIPLVAAVCSIKSTQKKKEFLLSLV